MCWFASPLSSCVRWPPPPPPSPFFECFGYLFITSNILSVSHSLLVASKTLAENFTRYWETGGGRWCKWLLLSIISWSVLTCCIDYRHAYGHFQLRIVSFWVTYAFELYLENEVGNPIRQIPLLIHHSNDRFHMIHALSHLLQVVDLFWCGASFVSSENHHVSKCTSRPQRCGDPIR